MKKNRKEKVKRELYIGKYPFSQYIPVIFFISIIAAIGVLLSSVENNVWTIGSAVYLLLAFFLYHYSNNEDKLQKDNEIAELKQKIKKIEETTRE